MNSKLIVVSNRLPITLSKDQEGNWQSKSSSGGLATALQSALSQRGGTWVGWPGVTDVSQTELEQVLAQKSQNLNFEMKPVALTAKDHENFYYGFSNEILWPLAHDFVDRANFLEVDYWEAYQKVNTDFAAVVKQQVGESDIVWIHDYHLMMVGTRLKEMGVQNQIGFFLHIPFPGPGIFLKLPWATEILESLLSYDLVGFQTRRDVDNFLRCCKDVFENDFASLDPPPEKDFCFGIRFKGKRKRVGAFPIGVDFEHFDQQAQSPEVETRITRMRQNLDEQKIVFGLDRLDYSKGIPERLEAFRILLRKYPQLREKVVLVQGVVPSREDIPQYKELKIKIDRIVSEINGEFTCDGWGPVQYIYRPLDFHEMLAYYVRADVSLVTPLKDGMNLIAKETIAANFTEEAVIVLSKFAGAAVQLEKAFQVNPFDIYEMAETIAQGLNMEAQQKKRVMRELRKEVKQYDLYWWLDSFLEALQV